MQDKEMQREFLKETVDPAHALRLGVNFEQGYLNQLQVSTIPPTVDSHNISTPFLQRECTTKLKKYNNNLNPLSNLPQLWPSLVFKSEREIYCNGQNL